MASDKEVAYHCSFLSAIYVDSIANPGPAGDRKRAGWEIDVIKRRDPEAFEEARKSLAALLNVPYRRPRESQEYPGDVGGWSPYVEGNPPDAQVAECMVPDEPLPASLINPTTGIRAFPNMRGWYKAYILNGKNQYETKMYLKMDQDFQTYAHEWESKFSNLINPPNGGFDPVLSHSYEVIGHFGTFNLGGGGTSLIVPSELVGMSLQDMLQQPATIFVDSADAQRDGYEVDKQYTSEHYVQVRTSRDGEVVDAQLFSTGGLGHPWYSPSDFIAAAGVLISLGKVGVRLATSMVRGLTLKLAARSVLRGGIKALAKDSGKAVKAALRGEGKDLAKDVGRDVGRDAGRDVGRDAGRDVGKDVATRRVILKKWDRMKGISRELTPAQMEAFVRDVFRNRPWLARLRVAQRLGGQGLKDAVNDIIKDWKAATGKDFLVVENDTSLLEQAVSGGDGWAKDLTGKEVLIVTEERFNDPARFLSSVRHELCNEAARGPLGQPALAEGALRHASDWLEAVIVDGEPVWDSLRSMGREVTNH
jgi:hypothetical protein